MNKPLTFAAPVLATLLAGCSLFAPSSKTYYPPYEGAGYTDRAPTRKEQLLASRNFSLEIASVEDTRRPRSDALDAPDAVRYEYEPNDLLQGLTYRVPVLLNKYMVTNAKQPRHYLVDVKIRNIKAQVVNGTVWQGGRMGRYRAVLELDVLARRAGSSLIVMNEPLSYELYQARHSFNGRDPSAEMDRARVYDLLEDAFRQAAERTAWLIRSRDRGWDPVADQIREDKAAAAEALREQKAAQKAAEAYNRQLEEQGLTPPVQPMDQFIAPDSSTDIENWHEPIEDTHPASWGMGT